MPRVHIHLHDIDEIDTLEEQESWEKLIGMGDERRDTRNGQENRGRGERRFGGSDVVARKRAERRKTVVRAARRV